MRYYTRFKISEDALSFHYETLSINDILDEYFPDWVIMMARYNNPITEDGCIRDWIAFNQAWETDSNGLHVLPPSASEGSSWS